jgi:hypothetical protein
MDMAPEEVGEGCLCGVKNCPDEYDHVTHGV